MTRKRNCSTPRRDEFAELLSQDLPRPEIMARMGLSAEGYKSHMKHVRRDLGWQAQ